MPCWKQLFCFVYRARLGKTAVGWVERIVDPRRRSTVSAKLFEERFAWKRQPNWTTKPAGVDDGWKRWTTKATIRLTWNGRNQPVPRAQTRAFNNGRHRTAASFGVRCAHLMRGNLKLTVPVIFLRILEQVKTIYANSGIFSRVVWFVKVSTTSRICRWMLRRVWKRFQAHFASTEVIRQIKTPKISSDKST